MSKKNILFMALTIISITTLNVSNIISGKQLQLPFGLTAAAGIIVIPIVYVVNDCVVEVFGLKKGMLAALISYATNLFSVAVFSLAIILPHTVFYHNQDAYALILGSAPRFLVASGVSFIVATAVNAGIMQVMHNVHGERFVFLRCWVSTVFGEICDKSIYMFMAFAFVLPTFAILGNILTSTILAIVYETILYPLVTRHAISWAKKISA